MEKRCMDEVTCVVFVCPVLLAHCHPYTYFPWVLALTSLHPSAFFYTGPGLCTSFLYNNRVREEVVQLWRCQGISYTSVHCDKNLGRYYDSSFVPPSARVRPLTAQESILGSQMSTRALGREPGNEATKIPFVQYHTRKLLSSAMYFGYLGGIVRYAEDARCTERLTEHEEVLVCTRPFIGPISTRRVYRL